MGAPKNQGPSAAEAEANRFRAERDARRRTFLRQERRKQDDLALAQNRSSSAATVLSPRRESELGTGLLLN